MPHDVRGRKIEVGDYVKAIPYNYNGGRAVVGPTGAGPSSGG